MLIAYNIFITKSLSYFFGKQKRKTKTDVGLKISSKEDYLAVVDDYDLIAIGETVSSDHQTSINIADRYIENEHFFLLESATQGPGSVARYSFLGIDALSVVKGEGEEIEFTDESGSVSTQKGNSVSYVSDYVSSLNVGFSGTSGICVETDLFLSAGATGYISYGVSSVLEPSVGAQPEKQIGLPDVYFFIPKTFLVFDQLSQNLHVFRFIKPASGSKKEKL